ncbi:MAG: DegV family protein [Clostridia bacterium]|nr:DegV family protein [Clostridia bacterium]
MSLIKFMTICDDELLLQNRLLLKKYDISAYPSVYFCEKKPYIDTINTNSELFYKDFKTGKVTSLPTIPADFFEYEFQNAYNSGYFGVFIIFPHNRWTDFKHQAEIAKKRFLRKIEIDEEGFIIKFYDSKTFAGGTVSQTLEFAKLYQNAHFSVKDFYDLIRSEKQDKYTYILSKNENMFDADTGLKGYIIKNNKITRMDISQHSDSVIYDLFAEDFVKHSNGCRYDVSVGYNCDFAGNILGRISKLSGLSPSSAIKYGVPTTRILGNSALCLSFVKKFGLNSTYLYNKNSKKY